MTLEDKRYEREECERHKTDGGDVALFWAGRMARAILPMQGCKLSNLVIAVDMADFYRQQYDKEIMRRARGKGILI